MRESDITPEVIRLSKEIAKHWRMEIYEGCWRTFGSKAFLVKSTNLTKSDWGIPIPSISDCLEKLKELGWLCRSISNEDMKQAWCVELINHETESMEVEDYRQRQDSDSLHEALLSALLEVLE